MKKIKWQNVIDLFVLTICITVLIHDVVMLCRGWSFTYFGILVLFVCCLGIEVIIQDFLEQLKSTPKNRPKFDKGTSK